MMVAACSSSEGGSKELDEAAPVTLTWWTGQQADQHKQLIGLAKEFTEQHPNVTIDVSSGAPTTDGLLQKLAAGFASDNYPDISYAYGSWAGRARGIGAHAGHHRQGRRSRAPVGGVPGGRPPTASPQDGPSASRPSSTTSC